LLELEQLMIFDCNVYVLVGPALPTQQGIDTPSAVDPDANSKSAQGRIDLNHIHRCHAAASPEVLNSRMTVLSCAG
jgi:hypothetical protein